MSTVTVEIRSSNAVSAGETIVAKVAENPNFLTEADPSMPRVDGVTQVSPTTPPEKVNVLAIVLPVVFGTLAIAALVVFGVWYWRKRRFDKVREQIPMNPSYLNDPPQ